ncbi:hypothetical protein K1719_004430 [Acacia pycnantha]|nr:hypothetical protein K1719_004430 [Acacia pycnantha]
MRAGICSIQLQALTPEAANVVKQAVSLATRRGHAQVTPLHVASAMLATSSGLLRRACVQCHSHPLQCKALELCFNVALNRLPASTPSPLLGHHYGTSHCNSNTPSLSNALVAAFKRAQSHQRRGSIETQNQPILSLKIEIEQLVISILDDPSVSRVMREAGFSSTLVKSKVEQSVSLEISPHQQQNTTSSLKSKQQPHQVVGHGSLVLKPMINDHKNDDVENVVSDVLNKKRNVIVVSESVGSAEGLARGVMERIGNVVQVVSVPLESFRYIRKEEVERKILELRCLVKSYVGIRGVVLYLGDLKWLFEFWESHCGMNQKDQMTMMLKSSYCSVDHMVMEMKRLVSESDGNYRVCLMGISTVKAYLKCKTNCHPSLESLWELYPFTVPVPSLSLSLNIHRDLEAHHQDACFEDEVVKGVRKNLTCCRDCSVSFEREAQSIINSSRLAKKESSAASMSLSSTSRLPTWLQNCKQEQRSLPLDDQDTERLRNLCKKWNCFCSTVHKHTTCNNNMQLLSEAKEPKSECELYTTADDVVCYESNSNSNLIMFMPAGNNNTNNNKPELLSNPNSSPNSASSSEAMDGLDSTHMFKDLNEENLKILCDSLEKKVSSPRNKHVVHEISSTVLRCRSGTSLKEHRTKRQDTWMLFLGGDCNEEKENLSRELAKTVFGSYTNFVTINGNNCSFSLEDEKMKKRKRTGDDLERFGEALNENPHRVFFIMMQDNLDKAEEEEEEDSRKGIQEAIESGSLRLNGELIPLKDSIVILSCERICDYSDRPEKKKKIKEEESLCLDLNIAIDSDGDCSSRRRTGNILELVDKKITFNTSQETTLMIGDDQQN